MADRYARIYGTEEDNVNCPFFIKMGACRHGDRCGRSHNKPLFSQTLLIPHLYQLPAPGPDGKPNFEHEDFDDFVEDLYDEFRKFGEIENLAICENLGDHMIGNVYVRYATHEEAEAAVKALHGRFYNGRLVLPEYSPVSDFHEARCRQFDENECNRGGYCNFMHLKKLPREVRQLIRILDGRRSGGSGGGYGGGGSSSRSGGRDRDRFGSSSSSSSSSSSRGSDRDRHSSSSSSSSSRSSRRSRSRSRSASPKRSNSEERRLKFQRMNQERAQRLAAAGAGPTPDVPMQ